MWTPEPSILQQLISLLQQTQHPAANQQELLDQLHAHKGNADFNSYLGYIFAYATSCSEVVRHTAALILKNNVASVAREARSSSQGAGVDIGYLRQCCLAMLPSPVRPLRQTAGTLAVALLGFESIDNWMELVRYIMQALQDSAHPEVQDGVLSMLYKVAEDFPFQLTVDLPTLRGNPPSLSTPPSMTKLVDAAMEHIAPLFSAAHDEVRYNAVRTFNMLVPLMPQWLVANIDGFVHGLLGLAASQEDARIHREVCIGANLLLNDRPAALEPHLDAFFQYALRAMEHPDPMVAIEATTFWMLYPESDLPAERLEPLLATLVQQLLQHMVFEDHDEEVVLAEEAEAGVVRDSDADLKPFLGRTASGPGSGGSGTDGDTETDTTGPGRGGDETPREYTLRRSCAQTLDFLAVEFPEALLPHVLPLVSAYLSAEDWRRREAAILALGAIADGCGEGLRAHAPRIAALLREKMRDPQPNVRVNSCWAAARYAAFALADVGAGGPAAPDAAAMVRDVLAALLERMQEHNPCVHYAALSGVSCVAEQAARAGAAAALESDTPRLLATIIAWLPRYTRRNVRQAFETLIQVVQSVPVAMEDPELVRGYMEPLLARLAASAPVHVDVMPLLDTFIHLTMALGGNVERYAPRELALALAVADANASAAAAPEAGAGAGSADSHAGPMILTYALDLVTALVEVLGASAASLLATAAPADRVPAAALAAAAAGDTCVAQSGFALIGELAQQAPAALGGHGGAMLRACYDALEPARLSESSVNATNNACWALGLLAARLPGDAATASLLIPAAERLATMLRGAAGSAARRLRENAAISMGRLATLAPTALAPHLGHFLGEWCSILATIVDGREKVAAFEGLLAALRHGGLDAAPASFTSLCGALASWRMPPGPPPPLAAQFVALLRELRARLSATGQWEAALAKVEAETYTPRVRNYILQYLQG